MCRLLGYCAPAPRSVADALGAEQSAVFHDMARLHSDGWGSAWTTADGIRSIVSPDSGLQDARLTRVLTGDASTARIVHLRLATDGLVCGPQNTHPFVRDGFAFAHNGSLSPIPVVESLVSPARLREVEGTTDSERYFAAVLSRVDAGSTPFDAVRATAAALRIAFPHRSLNALLLTPDELIAVHASEGTPIPHGVFRASGLAQHDLPRNHLDAYYQMRYRRDAAGGVAFASSGLDVAGWAALPQESVARVEFATGALTFAPLADAERAAA